MSLVKKFLIGFVEEEIQARALKTVDALLTAEARQVRSFLSARRAELQNLTPFRAIIALVELLEKESQKRDRFAGVVWRLAPGLTPEQLEALKAEMKAIDGV